MVCPSSLHVGDESMPLPVSWLELVPCTAQMSPSRTYSSVPGTVACSLGGGVTKAVGRGVGVAAGPGVSVASGS